MSGLQALKPNSVLPLTDLCDDEDINLDAKFVDKLQELLESQNTSRHLIPFKLQLQVKNHNARKGIKTLCFISLRNLYFFILQSVLWLSPSFLPLSVNTLLRRSIRCK